MSATDGQRWGSGVSQKNTAKGPQHSLAQFLLSARNSAGADSPPPGHRLDISKDRELTTSPSCPLLHFQPAHTHRESTSSRRAPGDHTLRTAVLGVKTPPPTPASQPQDWPHSPVSRRSSTNRGRHGVLAQAGESPRAGGSSQAGDWPSPLLFPSPRTTSLPAQESGSGRVRFAEHFGLSGSFPDVLSAPPLRHTRKELTRSKTEGFYASPGSPRRVIARTASRHSAPPSGGLPPET